MKVRFYTFSKKYNSTAQPSTGYTEYECVIKSSSDVITPTVELQIGLSTNPSSFNYCHIPDYNRYYWVKDWTFYNHLWVAALNVDVLATWKPYIGDTFMYVYRASAQYDGNISDSKYPTTANVSVEQRYFTNVNKKFSEGFFVLGIYGENQNNTSMSYYSISGANFPGFLQRLYAGSLSDNNWNGTLSKGLRNAVYDVSSYIKSCRWYPQNPGLVNDVVHSVYVGGISIVVDAYPIIDSSTGESLVMGPKIWVLPKHPQARTRGAYCNVAPYSRYKLLYLPFGSFELNSAIVGKYEAIGVKISIDAISGEAIMNVRVGDNMDSTNFDTKTLLMTSTCKFGVDIPISVGETSIASVLSTRAGAFISATHGNVASFTVSGLSAITELVHPQLDAVSNSQGGLGAVNFQYNNITCEFYSMTDEDNNSNGRPLCKIKKPSALGGYIEGESTDFSAPATIDEMEEIKRFIDNGFYYE